MTRKIGLDIERQWQNLTKATPEVGLRFRNPDEAWQFWVAYGGRTGFDVRKRYRNLSKFDGKVTSCRFVCANEGH